MKIVICGAGIIGVSTAYYLAEHGLSCTLIEQTGVASAASGKAGGFLAKKWCDSYELGPLARMSFDMHMEFAKTDIGKSSEYRNVQTLSVKVEPDKKSKTKLQGVDWVDGAVNEKATLETPENSAQVHPYKLTHSMLEETIKKTNGDTKVVIGEVAGLELSSDAIPKVTGVKVVDGDTIPADVVLLAMGPWTGRAADWLPKRSLPPVRGQRAHSIVLQPAGGSPKVGPDCLFLQYRAASGGRCEDPEMYPRPDGTIYMCGLSDSPTLPTSSAAVTIDKCRISQLREMAYNTASFLERAELLTEQACFLPISPDGLPLLGVVPNVEGVFVATGHSCWGILNAPGTGKAMAELIATGKCTCIDLTAFDPNRFKKQRW